jgi:hypothetical protein
MTVADMPPSTDGDPLVYDPEAEPLGLLDQPQNDDEITLKDLLQSLQQIAAGKEALEKQRTELTAAALPLLKRLGRPAMVLNPVTGTVQVAGVREDETLEVPADLLLAELVKHFEAEGLTTIEVEFEADTVWKDVLKPPVVDTKEDGAFKRAVDSGRIPGYVVAKVATFKKKAGYVGFTKPKRHQ